MEPFFQAALMAVFTASVLVQFTVAVLAFLMIRSARVWLPWTVIAVALTLMGIRRLVSFMAFLGGERAGSPDLSAEFIALLISLLLLAGLLLLAPVMRSLCRVQEQADAGRRRMSDETRFRELFENIKSGVMVIEPVKDGFDFIVKDMNPAAERMENKGRELMTGRRMTEVCPEAEEIGLLDVLRRVSRSGKTERFPARYGRNGKDAAVRSHFIYRRPCGEVVCVYDDFTEQVALREQIRQREEHFRTVFDHTSLPAFSLDGAGRIASVNPAWTRMSGYERQEVIGRGFESFLMPDSRQPFLDGVARLCETGRKTHLPLDVKTRDGGFVTVVSDAERQRDESGNTVQSLWILHPAAPNAAS